MKQLAQNTAGPFSLEKKEFGGSMVGVFKL